MIMMKGLADDDFAYMECSLSAASFTCRCCRSNTTVSLIVKLSSVYLAIDTHLPSNFYSFAWQRSSQSISKKCQSIDCRKQPVNLHTMMFEEEEENINGYGGDWNIN